MLLSYGKLLFEPGDVLTVEDECGRENFIAVKNQNCVECVFLSICNKLNPNNTFAHHCTNCHFVVYDKKTKTE